MTTDLDPIVDNWYFHLDKGQKFKVVAVDETAKLIELQHFDGDVEEVALDEWKNMEIELSEEPENWSGPLDVAEQDDYGTEVTDTSKQDWDDPLEQFKPSR